MQAISEVSDVVLLYDSIAKNHYRIREVMRRSAARGVGAKADWRR
jgi:hypothetical protein